MECIKSACARANYVTFLIWNRISAYVHMQFVHQAGLEPPNVTFNLYQTPVCGQKFARTWTAPAHRTPHRQTAPDQMSPHKFSPQKNFHDLALKTFASLTMSWRWVSTFVFSLYSKKALLKGFVHVLRPKNPDLTKKSFSLFEALEANQVLQFTQRYEMDNSSRKNKLILFFPAKSGVWKKVPVLFQKDIQKPFFLLSENKIFSSFLKKVPVLLLKHYFLLRKTVFHYYFF